MSPTKNTSGPAVPLDPYRDVAVTAARTAPARATAIGVPVPDSGPVPREIGLDRKVLAAAGFDGKIGQTLLLPRKQGAAVVAVGVGAKIDAAGIRNAAAAFARAASKHRNLATSLVDIAGVPADAAAQAVVEGVLLARYRFGAFKTDSVPVAALALTASAARLAGVRAGADRGRITSSATTMSRDLANAPHNHLSAMGMADVAKALAKPANLKVEVFDKRALQRLGCGGLLGVNQGSAAPPAMIKLTYVPKGASHSTPRLTFVGKGIMYDSGGIALKPGDDSHAQMKNDMTGAGSILAAMSRLSDLGCNTHVTGYLMCTDNMPSGTAMALGDVITMRGGKTVEVLNTDAEGRLVMADALVLATEEPVDAIVDIATLTGATMRALGRTHAAVLGNNDRVIAQIEAAGAATDELVWEFPLERSLRPQLDSNIADLKNMGGPLAGQTTAALFLEEFIAGKPWAHIDIAGTAWADADGAYRTAGCTGFGARLLIELALNFIPPN